MTDFVTTLRKELAEKKDVTDSTIDAYVRTLTILNGKKPLKNLTFLKKSSEILDLLRKEYADNTIKAILATIVSVLSLFPKQHKLYEVYKEALDGKVEEIKETQTANEGKKTKKEEENWVTGEEIETKKEALQKEIDASRKKKTLTAEEFHPLLSHLLLSLYTEIPPRRNLDYTKMLVAKSPKQTDNKEFNYYDVKGKRFIFNQYKTVKTYGQQIVDLPPSLVTTLREFIKRHPLAKESKDPFPLLVDGDGKPLDKVNSITRLLNKIFGRKVGSTLLRKTFVSEKYGGTKAEQSKDADAMAHSVAEQNLVYIKVPTTEK